MNGYYSWATRGTAVFAMAFGFAPPSDVTIHQSHHFVVGDQGEQSLSFSASQTTIDRILKNRFATSLSQSSLAADGEFHFSREFSESFGDETALLRYDPTTQAAFYSWSGVD